MDEAEAPAQAVRSIITHLQRQKQRRATRSVESPGAVVLNNFGWQRFLGWFKGTYDRQYSPALPISSGAFAG